jgi:hypothetical protein
MTPTGYPVETSPADARLLDDLNLDSINAAELVAAAAKQRAWPGSGSVKAGQRHLEDVAMALREAGAAEPAVQPGPSAPVAPPRHEPKAPESQPAFVDLDDWVRNFAIDSVPQEV